MTISIEKATAQESDALEFIVTLSASAFTTVTVGYRTVSGSAIEGVDFRDTTGTLSFAPGETSATIEVRSLSDRNDEVDESLVLELFDPVGDSFADGGAVARAIGFVLDDDGTGPNLALAVGDPVVVEGDSGGTFARFDIALSRPAPSGFDVPYATADGSAVAQQDYRAANGQLSFAPGQQETAIDIDVVSDTDAEGDEYFSLVLTPPQPVASGGIGTVGLAQILDDDAGAPELSVSAVQSPAAESDAVEFVVNLSEPAFTAVTVDYRTLSGTAIEGVDFREASGRLVFSPGETSKTIDVRTFFDRVDETDEMLVLELAQPNGAVPSGDDAVLRTTGSILDADGVGPNLALFVSSPVIVEGDLDRTSARFEILFSQPLPDAIELPYQTINGSARGGGDYVRTSGVLDLPAGQRVAFVDVPVKGDTAREGVEVFGLAVTPTIPVANGFAGAVGVARILDDDAGAPEISASALDDPAEESDRLEFAVGLSEASATPVTVEYRTLSGSAAEDVDFRGVSGELVFAPGETTKTLEVTTLFDRDDEVDEAVVLE